MKLGHFLLCPAKIRRSGKAFGDGLTVHSPGQAELGIVPGIVRFGTVTGWLTAAAENRSNGARAKITQAEKLLKEFEPLALKGVDRIRHGGLLISERLNTLRSMAQKKEIRQPGLPCRTPDKPRREDSLCRHRQF